MGLVLHTTDGALLDLPPTLSSITTYVILEQERWFETELDFLNAWLERQMTAIDIGAEFGVYALSMARRCARVFAYEPDSDARRHLAQGRILSHVANLELAGEVPLLDKEDAKRQWSPDLVRISAGSRPEDVLAGGKRFFERHSPLVILQLDGTDEQKQALPGAIEALGYHTFRALPRAPQLVPRPAGQPLDELERNLFAAKKDQIVKLKSRRFIADGIRDWRPNADAPARGIDLLKRQRFVAPFASLGISNRAYAEALGGYETWRQSKNAGGLVFAYRMLSALCKASPTIPRLSTLARIAYEAGRRTEALAALRQVQQSVKSGASVDEMFWPPHSRFDDTAPDASSWTDWLIVSIIETIERTHPASGYFGPSNVNLNWLAETPWSSPEMERRRVLRMLKGGKPMAIPERLHHAASDHLNAEAWSSGAVERAAHSAER
jgi:hypothetical protein